MKLLRRTLLPCLLLGCGCAQTQAVEVVTLMSHGNCQGAEAGVQRISFEDAAKLRGGHLIGFEAPPQDEPDLLLVAISKGTRPTPGYSLSVAGPSRLQAGTLTVPVAESRPAPDAVLAQMLTHPCLVIGLEESALDAVRVVDADGELIGTLEL